MKVSELKAGPELNALVAIAQGWAFDSDDNLYVVETGRLIKHLCGEDIIDYREYQPSDHNKAQAFELIEKFKMDVDFLNAFGRDLWGVDDECGAYISDEQGELLFKAFGSTPAEAICKAVCASVWGDEIPDDVMEKVR